MTSFENIFLTGEGGNDVGTKYRIKFRTLFANNEPYFNKSPSKLEGILRPQCTHL